MVNGDGIKNPCYGVAGIFLCGALRNKAKKLDLAERGQKEDATEWRIGGCCELECSHRTVSALYFHRCDWKYILQISLFPLNISQIYFQKTSGFI
jgi:hypothetical protein